jgi:hypothetical protein
LSEKIKFVEIVCLANSRKVSGRCIAGKEQLTLKWIRPVSGRENMEISEEERRYSDGSMPKLLDIVKISVTKHQPINHQTENYLINNQIHWQKTGRFPSARLKEMLDSPADLWGIGRSSYQGLNDRVPDSSDYRESLYLIKPENITIIVRIEGAEFNNAKRKVRVRFDYQGQQYLLPVTDPMIERTFLTKGPGEYILSGNIALCVSLGLAYEGYCYKFASAVIKA